MTDDRPYQDEDWLRQKYNDEWMTLAEIGDLCDVHDVTILNWMKKFGIERRRANVRARKATYLVEQSGYCKWYDGAGGKHRVAVHRLLAVAEHGFDAVCDNVVHHKNGVKWDNRPDNIEVMGKGEHQAHHAAEQPWMGKRDNDN